MKRSFDILLRTLKCTLLTKAEAIGKLGLNFLDFLLEKICEENKLDKTQICNVDKSVVLLK